MNKLPIPVPIPIANRLCDLSGLQRECHDHETREAEAQLLGPHGEGAEAESFDDDHKEALRHWHVHEAGHVSLKSVCGWLFRSGLVGLLFKLNCSSRFFRVTATATVLKQVSSINSLFTVQCSVFTSLVCRLTSHQLMSWTSNMKF